MVGLCIGLMLSLAVGAFVVVLLCSGGREMHQYEDQQEQEAAYRHLCERLRRGK